MSSPASPPSQARHRKRSGSPWLVPAALLATALAIGCKSDEHWGSRGSARPKDDNSPAPDPSLTDVFGDGRMVLGHWEADDIDLAPYVAMARAVVGRRDRAAVAAPAPTPGRRVFLSVHVPGERPVVATGIGTTLADSVVAAAEAALPSVTAPPERFRIQLEIATFAEAKPWQEVTRSIDIGAVGYLLARDRWKVAYVLPTEIIVNHFFEIGKFSKLHRLKMRELMEARSALSAEEAGRMKQFDFKTQSGVESSPPGQILGVSRNLFKRVDKVTPEELLAAVSRGADFITRITRSTGRYVYLYKPVEDRENRDDSPYSMLRHCGTTYALLEAYEELGTPAWLETAERGIAYLKAQRIAEPTKATDPPGEMHYLIDAHEEEMQKVGGAGLGIVALAKHASVTGKRGELDTMRSFARYILHQQYPDGHFRGNTELEKESPGKKLKKDVMFYPGEAMLGLLRLYALDPDPKWLEAARKGADYCVFSRDAQSTEDTQEHDHWLVYALNELYRVTKQQAYLDHALKIAHAILKKVRTPDNAGAYDFVGTMADAQSSYSSARLEAVNAAYVASRFAGKPDETLLPQALDMARFTLSQQYTSQNNFFVRQPARVVGAVREGLFNYDIRIDYVQHAMSGWLHLARILRDPAYGKTGVPSQDPVRAVKPVTPAAGKRVAATVSK